ncbi:MAG: hypothetical protein PVJ62_02780 [Deltaproteobacteria bacterium]|jgi:hypothetical protein
MDSYLKTSKALIRKSEHEAEIYSPDQWDRWDEELVADFGRWLGRLGKALAILLTGLLAVSAI